MYNDINNVVGKVIIRGVSNMNDVNELLNEAIKETANLKEEEIFFSKKSCLKAMSGTEYHEVKEYYLEHYFYTILIRELQALRLFKTTSGQQNIR